MAAAAVGPALPAGVPTPTGTGRAAEAAGDPGAGGRPGPRELKRRALRDRLSETATEMFLEHGFDTVRVSDVASACGVSTKTVWNHFPTKEALLFDRGETLAQILTDAAANPTDVLAAVVACIREEIARLDCTDAGGPGPQDMNSTDSTALRTVQAFALLCELHPSVRAATADRLEHLTQLAAEALATQRGTPAGSAENLIGASALVTLWRVHLGVLLRHAASPRPLADVQQAALAEVEAGAAIAARIL